VSPLDVEPLGAGNVDAWVALFERAASPCFCRFWHFGGTKNEWLARCAMEPEANASDARGALAAGADGALGLVALERDTRRAVGWMKVAPRASLPKLRGLPIYRGRALGDDDGVFALGCFLVAPSVRRRGVAAALLDAAPGFVKARGGRAIEAYPRHAHESAAGRLHDEEAMMGPEALFTKRGFLRIDEGSPLALAQYPVYRLQL
jgi:GNAT superfamily N-acetyltransferase